MKRHHREIAQNRVEIITKKQTDLVSDIKNYQAAFELATETLREWNARMTELTDQINLLYSLQSNHQAAYSTVHGDYLKYKNLLYTQQQEMDLLNREKEILQRQTNNPSNGGLECGVDVYFEANSKSQHTEACGVGIVVRGQFCVPACPIYQNRACWEFIWAVIATEKTHWAQGPVIKLELYMCCTDIPTEIVEILWIHICLIQCRVYDSKWRNAIGGSAHRTRLVQKTLMRCLSDGWGWRGKSRIVLARSCTHTHPLYINALML